MPAKILDTSVSYVVSDKAYLKIFFHAAKHPYRPVNGVLVGKYAAECEVVIEDAIPLLHHWTSLSPMMEIALSLTHGHAEELGSKLVGYYQACARIDDTALAPVGEKIASKIKDEFKDAVAFVIDGEKLGTGHVALIPYVAQASSSSWRPVPDSAGAFTAVSPFSLASPEVPMRAVQLVRETRLHQKFGDFDDHLEDVSIDWLRNRDCFVGVS